MSTRIIILVICVNLIPSILFSQDNGIRKAQQAADSAIIKLRQKVPLPDSILKSAAASFRPNLAQSLHLTSFQPRADSLPQQLMRFPLGFTNNLFKGITAQENKAAALLNFKKQFGPVTGIYKNPIVFNHGEAAYTMTDNGSYSLTSGRSYFGDLLINSSWTVIGVPFEISFDNQTWNDIASNNFTNGSLHFDREAYLTQLKKKLKPAAASTDLLSNLNNPVETLRKQAEGLLEKDLQGINTEFGNLLDDKLTNVGDLKTLFSKDMLALRQQLASNEYMKAIEEKRQLLTELQNRKNAGLPVDAGQMANLEQEMTAMKGTTALLAKIEEHKKKWESSGLLHKMKQLDLLNKKNLEKIAKDPATIIKQAKQQLNLNGFQRFFLKLNNLNIGQNTLSASPLSVQHLLNKGANLEFLNNNKMLMLGMGKMQSINSILDMPFTNNLMATDGMMQAISMGVGASRTTHTHVSVMSYNQSFGSWDGFSSLNSFRNSLVTTISNQVNIGARGVLKTEVSRSATTYQNNVSSDSTVRQKPAAERVLSGDDFFKNMAFSLRYEDEYEASGIAYGVHVGRTANGYVNPGNSFLNSGGKELGFNFRKSFWKRKLQASIRTEVREFNYNEDKNDKWRNIYAVMDVRWRFRKGQSIAFRYIPNRMLRIEEGKKSTVSLLDKFSLEGTLAQRIAGTYYRNTLTLAWQKNQYRLGNEPVLNTSLILSSFQNVTINKKLLYFNAHYNYVNNPSEYVYFNSSLMAEAGITYLLFKKVSSSSALSYNSINGWYRQVGIRQTISNQLNERFNLNLYIDARKNIQLLQPLLYGLFRADISIQYAINK